MCVFFIGLLFFFFLSYDWCKSHREGSSERAKECRAPECDLRSLSLSIYLSISLSLSLYIYIYIHRYLSDYIVSFSINSSRHLIDWPSGDHTQRRAKPKAVWKVSPTPRSLWPLLSWSSFNHTDVLIHLPATLSRAGMCSAWLGSQILPRKTPYYQLTLNPQVHVRDACTHTHTHTHTLSLSLSLYLFIYLFLSLIFTISFAPSVTWSHVFSMSTLQQWPWRQISLGHLSLLPLHKNTDGTTIGRWGCVCVCVCVCVYVWIEALPLSIAMHVCDPSIHTHTHIYITYTCAYAICSKSFVLCSLGIRQAPSTKAASKRRSQTLWTPFGARRCMRVCMYICAYIYIYMCVCVCKR